jgi:hypothetical protein
MSVKRVSWKFQGGHAKAARRFWRRDSGIGKLSIHPNVLNQPAPAQSPY